MDNGGSDLCFFSGFEVLEPCDCFLGVSCVRGAVYSFRGTLAFLNIEDVEVDFGFFTSTLRGGCFFAMVD